jgi:hypothetical protein
MFDRSRRSEPFAQKTLEAGRAGARRQNVLKAPSPRAG